MIWSVLAHHGPLMIASQTPSFMVSVETVGARAGCVLLTDFHSVCKFEPPTVSPAGPIIAGAAVGSIKVRHKDVVRVAGRERARATARCSLIRNCSIAVKRARSGKLFTVSKFALKPFILNRCRYPGK